MAVPDHTTVSRRAMSLPSIAEVHVPDRPLHVLIDSTGLKVYRGRRVARREAWPEE